MRGRVAGGEAKRTKVCSLINSLLVEMYVF